MTRSCGGMELYLCTRWAADVVRVEKHTVGIKNTGRKVEEGMLSPQDEADRHIGCRSSGLASDVAKSSVRAMVVSSIVIFVPGVSKGRATRKFPSEIKTFKLAASIRRPPPEACATCLTLSQSPRT
jgi:hypothetical protein